MNGASASQGAHLRTTPADVGDYRPNGRRWRRSAWVTSHFHFRRYVPHTSSEKGCIRVAAIAICAKRQKCVADSGNIRPLAFLGRQFTADSHQTLPGAILPVPVSPEKTARTGRARHSAVRSYSYSYSSSYSPPLHSQTNSTQHELRPFASGVDAGFGPLPKSQNKSKSKIETSVSLCRRRL